MEWIGNMLAVLCHHSLYSRPSFFTSVKGPRSYDLFPLVKTVLRPYILLTSVSALIYWTQVTGEIWASVTNVSPRRSLVASPKVWIQDAVPRFGDVVGRPARRRKRRHVILRRLGWKLACGFAGFSPLHLCVCELVMNGEHVRFKDRLIINIQFKKVTGCYVHQIGVFALANTI